MNARRARTVEAEKAAEAPAAEVPSLRPAVTDTSGTSAIATRVARPHSRVEAETRYVAVRDAWLAAMHAAASGRPADLASLAITQEAYEAAAAERERWIADEQVAIDVRPERTRVGVEAVVGQELAWRRVRESESKAPGLLGRLARKLRGR